MTSTTTLAARTVFTPIDRATLTVAEDLLIATCDANAAEPYVAADYDAPYNALMALLTVAFGPDGATAVREATLDGLTVAAAIQWAQGDARARLADAYDTATLWQAEHDAQAAFDAVAAGKGDPAEHLRTFAAATAHLDAQGCFIVLNPDGAEHRIMDEDDAAARFVGAMDLVTAHVAPCGMDFDSATDATDHEVTCGACAGATDGEVIGCVAR